MIMKHLKASLLLILLVIISCTLFKGDVKAGNGNFFKEYSSKDSYVDEEYNFTLKYKCRLTIYMKGEKKYEEDDYFDDEGLYVKIYNSDEDSIYLYDDVFVEEISLTDWYQEIIIVEPGKYTLCVGSDGPYYVSLSGEYYPELSWDDIELEEGKTQTLKVYGTSSEVNWSSSKKSVATVSKKGVVKAKKAGKAVITAKCGKYTLKCKVTVKKPILYKAIAREMKTFAKKNKNYKFKNIDVGKKCRLYGNGTVSYTDFSGGYGLAAGFQPYMELVKKSNGRTEIRLRIYGEMYEMAVFSTSLYCDEISVSTSNRRMYFKMRNTYDRNSYNYSGHYYEGRMKGYAQISSSSYPEKSNLKKFNTMLGQNSLSMELDALDGTYLKFDIPAADRNNWKKLLKEYNILLKRYQ